MTKTSVADSRVTRAVYVSTDISRVPRDAPAVAGRINGPYCAPVTDWQLFGGSALIAMDALGTSPEAADVLDIYSGNATLADLGSWWDKHVAARSRKPAVRVDAGQAAQVHQLLPPQHCALWVVVMGGSGTFPGATVVENTVMAAPRGALVTVGAILDPHWMPTPPSGAKARAAFDKAHPHMTRMRTGIPLNTPVRNTARGDTR